MTSFNRRETTLAALQTLAGQRGLEEHFVAIFLVDDASTDGTGAAVRERFPAVELIAGDGTLFWNRGMHKAFAAALQVGFDAYIWFNDDTLLTPDALSRLLTCMIEAESAIIVGSTQDPSTGKHTYGGMRRVERGLKVEFIAQPPDAAHPVRCDTMNGNCTLIPAAVAERLGNLDDRFHHQLGDVDYGLRATQAGIPILIAPGYFGFCSDNPQTGTWRDRSSSLAKRWKNLMSPKGAPPREWLRYTFRHFGWRAPLYAISPYLKVFFGR
jgi:GT2 family glycosyltransferase